METIFHEKQEGSLCAQHCLNALLQGQYFTPVELATLAQRMDDEERLRMAELGVDTEEYRQFMAQPSGNMDDSGYFSVQVLSSALEVWGLELIPFTSSETIAVQAQQNPESMNAYICHYKNHWFTIRKLGFQWFNLNSLHSGPELVSETYLGMFLTQLQREGYSIFVVRGELPQCTADVALRITPAVQQPKKLPPAKTQEEKEDEQLQAALRMSLGEEDVYQEESDIQRAIKLSLQEDDEDPALEKALQLSLQVEQPGPSSESGSSESLTVNPDDVRRARLAYFESSAKSSLPGLNT